MWIKLHPLALSVALSKKICRVSGVGCRVQHKMRCKGYYNTHNTTQNTLPGPWRSGWILEDLLDKKDLSHLLTCRKLLLKYLHTLKKEK